MYFEVHVLWHLVECSESHHVCDGQAHCKAGSSLRAAFSSGDHVHSVAHTCHIVQWLTVSNCRAEPVEVDVGSCECDVVIMRVSSVFALVD